MPDQMKIVRDVNDNGVLVMQGIACDTVTPVGAYMALMGSPRDFCWNRCPLPTALSAVSTRTAYM